ncbi:guanine nucleotide-binding protein subunit alpha [Sugiyamaella lignohabitans]|uniref:Guanine nucleotide-binding protein subunit alpha n=1 Tax=Sugiyamaella lignohabitans TaxID=796027 RepID=A0A167F5H1_9ASCO|nr:guanine nucleotide-binding protein subunit alpha [Sugiyamaella lignohabitans]ANB14852.1 guanine nucleotide-binding protein subunit alpha [Sugiyamaella lignohabitans]
MGSCLSSPKSTEDNENQNATVRLNGNAQGANKSNVSGKSGGADISSAVHVQTNGGSNGNGPLPGGQTPLSTFASTYSGTNSTQNNTNGNNMISPAVSGVPMQPNSSNDNSGKDPVKILLLGSGESGKSTILKQMKIIHQNGYSQEERLMYKTTVYKNLLDCSKAVVDALAKFGISVDTETTSETDVDNIDDTNGIETTETAGHSQTDDTTTQHSDAATMSTLTTKRRYSPVSQQDLDYISKSIISPDPDTVLDPELVSIVERLWARPEVRKLVSQRRSEFYIMDSAPYFFSNVKRIGDPDYIPSVNDILRARIKTTGIYETRFDMGGLDILMYDVGGQRSERKKWIHCFENVTLVIFCVALSEYDQVLLEQKGQNRMAESLVLFDSIINSPWFARTSVVLFLNKIDVFTEKLPYSPLENYFPDYTGGNDVNKAVKYILYRFTQTNRAGLNIYPHLTQATDTSNIRLVFAAVKETILQNALKDSGIL